MRRFVLSLLLLILLGSYVFAVRRSDAMPFLPNNTYLPLILKSPPLPTATPIPPTPIPPTPVPTVVPTPQPATFEEQVLELINRERVAHGCASLNSNLQLNTAAENHSQDMANRNYFAHNSPPPNASTPSSRAQAVGYPFSVGENIAAGQATPQQVVSTWMGSQGHRTNILNCAYQSTGIGYVYDANDTFGPYRHYWVQMFGVQ